MNPATRRTAMVTAAVVGALLVMMAALAGPPTLVSPGPASPFSSKPHASPTPTPTASPSATPPNPVQRARERHHRVVNLTWLGRLITWTLLVLLSGLFVAGLSYLWRHRWRPPPRPVDVDGELLPARLHAVGTAIAADAGHQLELLGLGTPVEGIVACWESLEQAVEAAGLPRQRWETSTEFAVRVLHRLDLDPRAVAELASLYREARFSEHVMDEAARSRARLALARLHSELLELEARG